MIYVTYLDVLTVRINLVFGIEFGPFDSFEVV